MSHTIEAPVAAVTVTATVTARTLLAGAVVAGPLFLGAGLIQGLTRDGFDFTRNALSQLSLGGPGWMQVASFLLTGVLLMAGAVGMRRVLRGGPGGVWAPRLTAVFGASFLLSAVFTADPGAGFPAGAPDARATSMSWHGALHMVSGVVGYVALCAAFLVLARHFAAQGHRGWAVGSRLVAVAVLVGFAGSAATVLAFTAGAGLGLLGLAAVTARLARAHTLASH
ncbi:DUF998 domain-containing protein [Streptomyces sp. NPDC053474]|uniref:DUF998 domain-containing protein n=1 Tax=Streptomyces sp. NPDC053474 TaxID=3365704 RepID=UPI0037CF0080